MSFPQTTGELAAEGLPGKIEILRDEAGIPHIRAATENDAWYGMGFVHGQDRLFQADVSRRLIQGRLSEWIGEEFVDVDAFHQSLDVLGQAEEVMRQTTPEVRFAMASYAAGMNAAAAAQNRLPLEYRSAQLDWEPWTPADSVSVSYLMAWSLASGLRKEISALQLRKKLDAETLDLLYRSDPERMAPVDAYWNELRQVDIGSFTPTAAAWLKLWGGRPEPAASNAWVVGPKLTGDGKPLLANDPHLGPSAPGSWYALEVQGGDLHVAGATRPGLPAVAAGHNGTVAWGVTNTMADYVDVAVLKKDGDNGYLLAGEHKDLVWKRFTIKVKGSDTPMVRDIATTELGPALTDPTQPYFAVLQWTGTSLVDRSPDNLDSLHKVGSVQEALALANSPMAVGLHMVFADSKGDYGSALLGSLPKRKAHSGMLPYPAWLADHGWDGWQEPKRTTRKPKHGYVHAANSWPGWLTPEKANEISTSFVADWRLNRIAELIEEGDAHTVSSMIRIQRDQVDLHARANLPNMLAGVQKPATSDAARCWDWMSAWDYIARPDGTGALGWTVFQEAMVRQGLKDLLGDEGVEIYLTGTSPGASFLDRPGWEIFYTNRELETRQALAAGCAELRETYGTLDELTWGQVHPLTWKHVFSNAGGLLAKIFNPKPLAWGGTGQTINAGGVSWSRGWEVAWAPSMRLVVPLGDIGASQILVPPGQSGAPGHPHYDDMSQPLLWGEMVPLWFHDEDVRAHAVEVLTLVPLL
jgi:penicillin amidase